MNVIAPSYHNEELGVQLEMNIISASFIIHIGGNVRQARNYHVGQNGLKLPKHLQKGVAKNECNVHA